MKKILLAFFILSLNVESNYCFSQAGVLDSTFDGDGIGVFPFSHGVVNSIVIQPNGKILAGGQDNWNGKLVLVRYKLNGTLDSSFGTNGKISTLIGLSVLGGNLALQPDGKILQSGYCIDNTGKQCFGLVRYKSNGTLDNSFSGDGKVITSFNSMSYDDYALGVEVQADGKIVQIGTSKTDAGWQGFAIVRFNTDGSLDNSFGTGGKVLFQIGNEGPEALSVAIQPDGKILMGGYSLSIAIAPSCFALAFLNANGILDVSFGTLGRVTTYFGNGGSSGNDYDYDQAYAMALQPDGKILLTGTSDLGVNGFSTPIARYNTDGSLDTTFGTGGKVQTHFPGCNLVGWAIALQADGKFLIAGLGGQPDGYYLAHARFNNNGTLDSS